MTTTIEPGTRVRAGSSKQFVGTVVPNTERIGLTGNYLILVRPDDVADLPARTADGLWSTDPGSVTVLFRVGDKVLVDGAIPAEIVGRGTPTTFDDSHVTKERCEKVAIKGAVRWVRRDRITTPTPDFPVGAMVRDVKYDLLGTVVQPREDGTVRASFPSQVGAHVEHTASFPDPVGRLERVHLLTHDELSVLDRGLRTGIPSDENDAADVVKKHLHPTVFDGFTVEVSRLSTADRVTVEQIAEALRERFGTPLLVSTNPNPTHKPEEKN